MFNLILNILFTIVAVILGMYILLAGRRYLWATTAVVVLIATANLLAVLVASLDSGRDLIVHNEWELVLIALVAAVLGLLLGRFRVDIATGIIGFVAGADIALWLYDMVLFVWGLLAELTGNTILWIGIGLILVGGAIGLYLTRRHPRQAIVLISVIVGVQIVDMALNLSPTSSFTAVILLSLALVGIVVQYAEYARETQKTFPVGAPPMPEENFDLGE